MNNNGIYNKFKQTINISEIIQHKKRGKNMFCNKCGNQLEDGAKFCGKCGAPVDNTVNKTSVSMPSLPSQYIRIGIIIASVLLALSTVLPYVKVKESLSWLAGAESISLLSADGKIGDGIFFILLAIITIVFTCLKKKIPVLICSVLSVCMYILETVHLKNQCTEVLGFKIDIWDYMTKGAGYHLLGISVILMLVFSIIYFIIYKKENA